MSAGCAFWHVNTVDRGKHTKLHPDGNACMFPNGTHVENYLDLMQCMDKANCTVIEDGWLQMAVLRDPRTLTVSAYYHCRKGRGENSFEGTVDQFVAQFLPLMSQWVAIRYKLFADIMSDRSTLFWYTDATVNPMEFHYRLLDAVGLQLPAPVVKRTVDAVLGNHFEFDEKGYDKHPGEHAPNEWKPHKFEDEVSPETLVMADETLRTWLPDVLLTRLGVISSGDKLQH